MIAITKDLPDVEGDRKYGIETFSTRLGTRAVAFLGKPACSVFCCSPVKTACTTVFEVQKCIGMRTVCSFGSMRTGSKASSCPAGSGLLAANYITAIVVALRMQHAFRLPVMVGANALFCVYLWIETARVDAGKYSQAAIAAYYRGVWNLFYAQYAILPFI